MKLMLGSKSRSSLISSSSAVCVSLKRELFRLILLFLPDMDFFLCNFAGDLGFGGLALSDAAFLAFSASDLDLMA